MMSITKSLTLYIRLLLSISHRKSYFKVVLESYVGLLRVSEYSDTRESEYKIEYEYSSLPKSLDRDPFFPFLFTLF